MSWTADSLRAGFTTGTPYRALSANVGTQNVQAQQAQPDSLLNFYKAMIGLRNSRLSIARGSYDKPFLQGSVLAYTRTLGQERTQVLINYADRPGRITLTDLPSAAVMTTLWPQGMAVTSANAGQAEIEVAPRSVRVLDVK
jgi:glycosidase